MVGIIQKKGDSKNKRVEEKNLRTKSNKWKRPLTCFPLPSQEMATQEEAAEEAISEHDSDSLLEVSALMGVDALQVLKELEKEAQKEREKMRKGFNSEMRSEAKRLKTFVTYDSYSSWTPPEMAAAGFYFTGIKSGVQCFCCSLVLFSASLQRRPIDHHKKFRPHCGFLSGKDVGNIAKYDIRVKNPERLRGDRAKYQEETARLESFEDWPFYAHGTSPRELSDAGFVFTGNLKSFSEIFLCSFMFRFHISGAIFCESFLIC